MSVSNKGSVAEDRISDLPESVISDILSRLPTKDAVRTCVLAKEWEFKWTSIYDMIIDDTCVRSDRVHKKASFIRYVERILLLSHNIRSFCLHISGYYDSSCITAWISAVLRRNVESFELVYNDFFEDLLLPRSLLNSISLRRLKLELYCSFKVPSKNCFPNLVHLYLHRVNIRNELSNSDTLTFNFPVLETMELKKCEWLNVKFVEINAPALNTFVSETPQDAQVDDYSITILVDRLTYFESSGDLPENLILIGSLVVHAALLHVEEPCHSHILQSGLQVRKLLNEFQSLEDLELSSWIQLAIVVSKEGLALPRYNNLQRLTLGACIHSEALFELLHVAPCLKSLVLDIFYEPDPDGYDYEAMESLPYCLVNQLEEVEFAYRRYRSMYDFRLEKFILKNGLVLEAFHLVCDHHEKMKILESLLTFPKSSNCLEFVIH